MNTTLSIDLPIPNRALAIGAHPDDIEFGCGATLAKWADAGCSVHLLVLTDGSKGTWDAHANIEQLITTRQQEQRVAVDVLGADDVHFLGNVDGELDSTLREREEVCRVIRATRPDVVLGHDPWKRYRLHPDHRHAGLLAIEGIVAARDPFFFPEQQLDRHRPSTLLLFEAEEVDHLESVDKHLERKVQALLAHESQWVSTHGIDGDASQTRDRDIAVFREGLMHEARTAAARNGETPTYAEAFKLITDL